ncbi:hypothetical protein H0H93_010539 [Arthromyces matolae]|nr:hypothetical protein H0H93_010539 [Arthromyces matolae]
MSNAPFSVPPVAYGASINGFCDEANPKSVYTGQQNPSFPPPSNIGPSPYQYYGTPAPTSAPNQNVKVLIEARGWVVGVIIGVLKAVDMPEHVRFRDPQKSIYRPPYPENELAQESEGVILFAFRDANATILLTLELVCAQEITNPFDVDVELKSLTGNRSARIAVVNGRILEEWKGNVNGWKRNDARVLSRTEVR